MPRTSNNVDYVQKDPKPYKHPKLPYPKPTPLPAFEPLQINNYDAPGTPNIPPGLDQHDPVALFRLFFTDEMVEKMVRWTNEYAKDHRPSKGSATSICTGWKDYMAKLNSID
ncbi:uncharacterized protein BDZ99DRAFT_573468 [Mytilinidion resinicola]|uniref:PiggyBac transposable element-derived protein domain-containing protein n=1 Tax=Mytilinidion resinicola TaxID=574789 RepID=A0A6A6YF98_9PEZI|nr:uncharacterized protein BDZ99DRAFT_573468 [Mytilinidion resinicola]KAF2806735.1 hypothetical protein BDZ99DRAFT_573468 [Mytilinidion resinicola]